MTTRTGFTVVALALAVSACDRQAQPAPPEIPTLNLTRWSGKTELYMEYPPLVAGQSALFAVHLTRMDDFRPVAAGQATIELAMTLPFIIWLIAYTFQAYYTIHTSHVAQKYAAMNLYQRVNNRAQFVMDDLANNGAGQLHNRNFMAVEYTEPDGKVPRRKIMFGPMEMTNIMGICREPVCR